jgi:hypothetical protein
VFKLRADDWSVDCNDLIVDFFSTVINAIKNKRSNYAKQLLEQLGEPCETHMGVSRGSTSGKGVSGKQANDLYERLSTSKAVASGSVTDISDCELMIPGIGFDKVSDITTNIIREKLILYTQEQCRLHGVPMRSIPSGKIWSPIEKRWLNGTYVDLPVYKGKRIILVPKYSVVFKMILSSRELYEKDIVEYIQAELGIDIGDTLIGMHLKPVAVPVRLNRNTIGSAHVVCARTRLKFIGGERAIYK